VVSAKLAKHAGTAMRLDRFECDSYVSGCKFIANTCFPLKALGGTFPESTIRHVVSGLERNALYVHDNNLSFPTVLASVRPKYLHSRNLGVLAGLSALAALVEDPTNIKTVLDADGVYAVLMALKHYDDHVQVCQQACLALTLLAPLDTDQGNFWKFKGIQKIITCLFKHPSSAKLHTNAFALLAVVVLPSLRFQRIFIKYQGVQSLTAIMDIIVSLHDKDIAESILLACSQYLLLGR